MSISTHTDSVSAAAKSDAVNFNAEAVRTQFPLLVEPPDGRALHYLDNAATAQVPQTVLDAVHTHETRHRSNVLRSVHRLAEAATAAYTDARVALAEHVQAASADEIVFTGGCTAAINLVAHAFGETLEPGDEIVVSALEHHSNLVPWQLLCERRGIRLRALPVTADGALDLDALETVVGPRCRLIALTHASNVTGAVTDVARVVAAARAVGARVLLDGAQYAVHAPVDVQALGVDFYCLSGHKLFGPNGVGVLWARSEILEPLPPFLGGGEMIRHVTLDKTTFAPPPQRFEAGTPPIAQAVGLAAAVRWLASLDRAGAAAHLESLTTRLLDGIEAIDAGRGMVRVLGARTLAPRLPIVSFDAGAAHPHDVAQMLDGFGVAVRGGHHCAQPLMDAFAVTGTTRASLALYNTRADVDACLEALDRALARLL